MYSLANKFSRQNSLKRGNSSEHFLAKVLKNFCVLFLCLCAANANAASESERIASQQTQVIQNQKQIDQEREIQVDLKRVKQEEELREKKEDEDFEEEELSKNDGKIVQNLRSIQCFRPREIIFSQNELMTAEEQKSLSEKYLNKCFTLSWLTKFDQEVEELLTQKGYVTSRAVSDPESFMKGKMRVKIITGMLEKIIINEDGFFEKEQLFAIFGFSDLPKGGKVLNIHEIEPALKLFNKVASNKAHIKIVKGSAYDKSIVVIESHPKDTLKLGLSFDNIGSKNTGVRRQIISISKDNLLHFNDVFTFSRMANDLDPQNDRRRNVSNSGSWSFPFLNHSLIFSGGKNSYHFLTGSSGKVLASGFITSRAVNFESLLHKDKNYKISSNFGFLNRDNQIFTDAVRNENQSRKASIFSAAVSNTFFLDNATLFLKPSYNKSLNILNSKQDNKNISRFDPHAEVEIFKLYANYANKFTMPYFESSASYNLTFDSQYSKQHLYGIDQISSGGFYSVRGVRSGAIYGDYGYNIRNEIKTNLGQVILPKMGDSGKDFAALNYFSIAPFYDYGLIANRGVERGGRLSSTGFKIGFSKGMINSSLTFARVLTRSAVSKQNKVGDGIIYFEVSSEMFFL